MNHKRLFRLYREERLMVRRRGGRKRALGTRAPMPVPHGPTIAGRSTSSPISSSTAAACASWRGRRLHARVPGAGRRHLDLRHAGRARTRSAAGRARQAQDHRQRQRHRADSNAILRWADDHKVAWHYIAPGKPVQNAFIESFIGRLRDELLNETLFRSLPHARARARCLARRLQHDTAALAARLAEPATYAAQRRSAALRSTDGSAPRTAAITAQQGITNAKLQSPLDKN